ncbi:protein kinase domain protein [Ichthyophthirius multifiliis]|uniref:Protein kinase domain protein n=1 Tax=Ichthyophthirius multifiliis TaxID=5932 RepID=G0QUL8_ICHMU|nr:protein kinase domain protein [Ichthyophthirius multifiliis]EGR31064.1 protein kinase domain protein [Ichthyophthirius multifiliis]|eukprot:XP_004034550.1 protein kinase domain protein [Ichthyophthirius multifiliis]
MDYCSGGDLDHLLMKQGKLSINVVKIYVSELVLAIETLHKNNIIYRDLKPSNVVIDNEGHVLITDFGLAKQGINQQYVTKSFCGSPAYLPPEMLTKNGHTLSLDWYLLGVLMYELLTGMPPFYHDEKAQLFENIKSGSLKFPKYVSADAKDLIQKLMIKDPMKRLGSKGSQEVKNHHFFSDVNWTDVYNNYNFRKKISRRRLLRLVRQYVCKVLGLQY